MAKDVFADIAAGYKVGTDRGLEEQKAPVLPQKYIELATGNEGVFTSVDKIDSREKLQKELERQRALYRPFLEDMAPKVTRMAETIDLKQFHYVLEGGGEKDVIIPHYEGPVGRQKASYTTTFYLNEFEGKSVVISCKGIDYIAEVYINGEFVGRHEGLFAPFEFVITDSVHPGENEVRIIVRNDYIMMANSNIEGLTTGDKVYAATGPGWDDPEVGWHHCPPGMGIYQEVKIEIREKEYITSIFPRITGNKGELWVECFGTEVKSKNVAFKVSLYGQNFEETVFVDREYNPSTNIAAGVGDTLTEASLIAEGKLGSGTPLLLDNGFNRFILPFEVENVKWWSPAEPNLYQVQVKMLIDGEVHSIEKEQFGIRTFEQNLESTPKGKFYLNGKEIRLFGANTMGFEQQDVMRGDEAQLIDDILLAKICNMNFLRLTQRPVQSKIYEICDRLGMMIQTDLPLFGTVRINQYCEVVRQAEEMEKLIRSHPSCILCSYVNEPFPNAGNLPHRMLNRDKMMTLFQVLDIVVKNQNPERVTKHVDGDYDPPNTKEPDNHCYTMWYNGHGIDMGTLYKGGWLDVAPGWHYGCGEFGAEGLDSCDTMRKYYPKEWLEPFTPNKIIGAQTGSFHYFFYETPDTMEGWVEESQRYQAFATKIMTQALRRNLKVNTFAIHLFIDAFPSGWMKSIMDMQRIPKQAYFAYRECLSPVLGMLRSDRFTFFGGETAAIESYLCNNSEQKVDQIKYYAELDGKIIGSTCITASANEGTDAEQIGLKDGFQGFLYFMLPTVYKRSVLKLHMACCVRGEIVNDTVEEYQVFPQEDLSKAHMISYEDYRTSKEEWNQRIQSGERVIFAPLSEGKYEIGDRHIEVTGCRMSPLYTVSRDTGHEIVKRLVKGDTAYWYDSEKDKIAPVIYATFKCEGARAVLYSGNSNNKGVWNREFACAEWDYGKGKVMICQLDLNGKEKNPCAVIFENELSKWERA